VMKTPKFSEGAMQRLENDFGGCYRYAGYHFGGHNPYLMRIDKNVKFAQAMSEARDTSALRRTLRLPRNRPESSADN
jgi:hypothetical protein